MCYLAGKELHRLKGRRFMLGQKNPPQEDHPFAHLEHPYHWYKQIRQPPFYSPSYGAWIISRYDDIRWVLKHPALFSARDTLSPPQPPPESVLAVLAEGYPPVPAVLNSDGDQHRRLRTLVETAIRSGLKGMRAHLHAQANALVDAFIVNGHADLMGQFALPLAFGAFCKLLAIPDGDIPIFRRHSDETLQLMASMVSPTPLSEERQIVCARSYVQLQHYLGGLVEQRRQTPGPDLISALVLAALPDEAPLADEEVVAVLVDILFGGYKTTAALIGNSVGMLLQTRGAWQDLHAHPTQIPLAVEEALRYDAPVQAMVRTATQAVVLPGATEPVQPETQVLLLYGAGNRDPDMFQQADAIDLQRKQPHHLAFGYGVHVCVGAPLARLEGRVALETLLRRLPDLQLREGQELTHVPTLMFRSLERLEVTWHL